MAAARDGLKLRQPLRAEFDGQIADGFERGGRLPSTRAAGFNAVCGPAKGGGTRECLDGRYFGVQDVNAAVLTKN